MAPEAPLERPLTHNLEAERSVFRLGLIPVPMPILLEVRSAPQDIRDIIPAEQGASAARPAEVKDLYNLPAELAVHVANLDPHIRRLEQEREGS